MQPLSLAIMDTWIIGYGNVHRRDDGIGPYVARIIENSLTPGGNIHIRIFHPLAPDLIEELRHAGRIIFIDASREAIDNGFKWTKIAPEPNGCYHVTHLFTPALILRYIQSLYQHDPETYLVSVQGDNFEFGDGLDPPAETRAMRAASEIISFLDTCLGRADTDCNRFTKGGQYGCRKNHTHH